MPLPLKAFSNLTYNPGKRTVSVPRRKRRTNPPEPSTGGPAPQPKRVTSGQNAALIPPGS